VFGTYRSHALYLARTGDTDGFFGELYGRTSGAARGKAGSMHLAAPERGLVATSAVVASTIPLAVGAALSIRQLRQPGVAVAFFGDGALGEGVFWESLNYACTARLPVLFVCEDNGLAIHARTERYQGYGSIAHVAERFHCDVHRSESSDVLEIRELTRRALEQRAASGRPVFLHLRCYRFVEHVGPSIDRLWHLGYRVEAEFEHWLARDPVKVGRARLLALGASEAQLSALEAAVESQVQASLAAARRAPHPEPRELLEAVFA
jgi:pyruvate dehydrogenase E1 component alpha subunit